MPISDQEPWGKIKAWELPYRAEKDEKAEPPRDCTCFEHNVRKLHDYTDESARRLTEEYRRFLYLKAMDGGVLTPPGCIDEAWHLHMTLVEVPDDRLVLPDGRVQVHQSGVDEATSFERYGRALELYGQEFEEIPPADIWPMADYFKDRTHRKTLSKRYLEAGIWFCGIALTLAAMDEIFPDWRAKLIAHEVIRGIVSPPFFGVLAFFSFGASHAETPPKPPKPNTIARCG